MRTYYFDMKDGAPVRDRTGIEFPTAAGAIEHSKELAQRFRHERRLKDPALSIIVVDESGTEIRREPVHPDAGHAARDDARGHTKDSVTDRRSDAGICDDHRGS